MPVPLSVTNPKAVGLAAAQLAELPTQGPFARLGQAADGGREPASSQQGAAAAAAVTEQAGAASSSSHWAIETHSLSFSYPDIGEQEAAGIAHPLAAQ